MALNLDMTLREFFELAERVGAAANVIREAQAMMGGAPVSPQWGPGPVATILGDQQARALRETRDAAPAVVMTNKGPVRFSDEEMAIKEKLRMEREARIAEEMPENIRNAMLEVKS